MFFFMLFSVVTLLSLYTYHFLSRNLESKYNFRHQYLNLSFILFYFLLLSAPLLEMGSRIFALDFFRDMALYTLLVRTSYFALGLFSCFVIYILIIDTIRLLSQIFLRIKICHGLVQSLILIALLGTIGTGILGFNLSHSVAVRTVDIPLKNLPSAFDNFKVVQLSDLHLGPFLDEPLTKNLVELIAPLNPDILILTGDIADSYPIEHVKALKNLGQLFGIHGLYYVTGNHEYYWDAPGWIQAVKEAGFEPLINEHRIIIKDGAQMAIAGVTDPTSNRIPSTEPTNLLKASANIPNGIPKLLLSHQPKLAEEASALGYDLQLSGHTHGGQYFPFTAIIKAFVPYITGLQQIGVTKLYVNRGTGFWGPPLRTNGPGEITLITLKRE